MPILLAFFSANSADSSVFRIRIVLVTDILCEIYRFQKTLLTSDAQNNTPLKFRKQVQKDALNLSVSTHPFLTPLEYDLLMINSASGVPNEKGGGVVLLFSSSKLTRFGRSIRIFSNFTNFTKVHLISYLFLNPFQNAAKELLYPILPNFVNCFGKELITPDGIHSDWGLKMEVLTVMILFALNLFEFPKRTR